MKRIYKTRIEAAHHIEGHKKCGLTHGHTYHLEVTINIQKDWVDFHLIKRNIDSIINQYDHHDMGNMTCEKLAVEIYNKIQETFRSQPVSEIKIRLFETEKFGVEFP